MRTIAIGFAAVLLLAGPAGCKKKDTGSKAGASGDMKPGGMKHRGMKAGGEEPDKRPVAEPDKPPVDKEAVPEGVLSEVKGTVEVRRAGESEFKAAAKDSKVFAKDAVRVGKDGEAVLSLWDNSSVELTAESAITLNTSAAIKNPSPSITVMAGAARFDVAARTEGQGAFSVYTPSAAVAVQGTVLAVGVGLSGNSRVAVETGNVAVTPVAKVEAKAVVIVAGKVVVVPMGKPAAAPQPYSAEKAGWDEWLEAEDQKAAKNADTLAANNASAVEQLNNDAQTLENAEDKESQAGENLQKQVDAAEKDNKPKVYVQLQPKLAAHLDTQAALHRQIQFLNAQRYARSYLLGLMAGRIEGGVYKTSPTVRAAVRKHYQRIALRDTKWEVRRLKRQIRYRRRVKTMQRAYYLHHADGRLLATRMKVEVPVFYRKHKPRRRMRRRVVIAGYNHPIYRRPVYRGKRRKVMAAAMLQHNRAWYRNKKWQENQRKRWQRAKVKRAVWRKASQRRAKRWAKRPEYHKNWRNMRRQWRGMGPGVRPGMGPHGVRPGMGPHGMRFGMGLRGMEPRGVGPHGVRPDMGPRGMRFGMGLRGMEPRGMAPRGMRFGMRIRKVREKLRRRRNMGM
jgi:hypothetical protein